MPTGKLHSFTLKDVVADARPEQCAWAVRPDALEHLDSGYRIPLDAIATPAMLADWLLHIGSKADIYDFRDLAQLIKTRLQAQGIRLDDLPAAFDLGAA